MKIILYEHISGGGFAGKQIPPDILAEGFAMLRTVASNFKAAGNEVTVLLDDRISKLNPPIDADCIVPVFYPEETKRFLVNLAAVNDASYIIAPETAHVFHDYVAIMEQTGKTSLNCQASAIQQVADKAHLREVLHKNHINTPKTLVLTLDNDLDMIKRAIKRELSYPIVIKPSDGVGCTGLSLISEDSQIKQAIEKIKDKSSTKHFLVQEFVVGEAASVSLLVSKGKALAISLNKQNVNVAPSNEASSYSGGCVPFDHSLKQEAFMVAQKVVECFSGLRGYVGVDFVLDKDKPFVVDVNPRLTTSYVGLSQTINFNLAQAIIDAVTKLKLPTNFEINEFSCFETISSVKPTISVFQEVFKIDDVVSPPFPLIGADKAVSLIVSRDHSFEQAHKRLEEARNHLFDIVR